MIDKPVIAIATGKRVRGEVDETTHEETWHAFAPRL
jgi:hypothetical protein